ncbi:MAG: TIR domain-containing protein, partial [Pseudonocardiaceae bacterium]
MRLDPAPPIDVFISYSRTDERWATWIAWQLETAGYHTRVQAWDFVPGGNFIDFMDRGVQDSAVVVALLSRNYSKSRYGRMEWQAALRTDPAKLVTIRIEDCPLEGLLATITYLDLVEIADPDATREQLLRHLSYALAGRAKPTGEPVFPAHPATLIEAPQRDEDETLAHQPQLAQPHESPPIRRRPQAPPPYPRAVPDRQAPREAVTLLHVPGPRFGRGTTSPLTARDLQAKIWANVTQLTDAGAPSPELILVTGDLMESGRPREGDEALAFLTGLQALLGLEPTRLIIVPGDHDVSRAACQGYFLLCESRDSQPQQPYFPKLECYAQLFNDLYQGLEGPLFDTAQPWTMFAVPELRVAIAGLNSTMSITHQPEDDYGWIGDEQAAWFARQLRSFEESGWLRIGVIGHNPDPGGESASSGPAVLRDPGTLDRLLGHRLNMLVCGPGPGGTSIDFLGSGLPVVPATGPGQEEIIQVTADGVRRFSAHRDGNQPALFRHAWRATGGTFPPTPAEELGADNGAPAPERLEPAPTHDPQRLLLDRIEEVCETRHDRVRIRRVETDPPHLLITRQEEGFTPQWRVGAHVGELNREVVESFLRHEPGPGSELVYE